MLMPTTELTAPVRMVALELVAHDASFWRTKPTRAISVGGWVFVGACDNSCDCRFGVAFAISQIGAGR